MTPGQVAFSLLPRPMPFGPLCRQRPLWVQQLLQSWGQDAAAISGEGCLEQDLWEDGSLKNLQVLQITSQDVAASSLPANLYATFSSLLVTRRSSHPGLASRAD